MSIRSHRILVLRRLAPAALAALALAATAAAGKPEICPIEEGSLSELVARAEDDRRGWPDRAAAVLELARRHHPAVDVDRILDRMGEAIGPTDFPVFCTARFELSRPLAHGSPEDWAYLLGLLGESPGLRPCDSDGNDEIWINWEGSLRRLALRALTELGPDAVSSIEAEFEVSYWRDHPGRERLRGEYLATAASNVAGAGPAALFSLAASHPDVQVKLWALRRIRAERPSGAAQALEELRAQIEGDYRGDIAARSQLDRGRRDWKELWMPVYGEVVAAIEDLTGRMPEHFIPALIIEGVILEPVIVKPGVVEP